MKTNTVICSDRGPDDDGLQHNNVYPSLIVTTGKFLVVPIQAPAEGRLMALHLAQSGGGATTATVELLCSRKPYGNDIPHRGTYWTDAPKSFTAAGYTVGAPPNLYRVMPAQTVGSGTPFDLFPASSDYTYNNVDGEAAAPERFLYLILTPAAASTWDLAITTGSLLGGNG